MGQLKDAQREVAKAQEAVTTAAAAYQQAKVDEVRSSFSQLQKDIESIPNSATLNEAKAKITPSVQAVQSSVQQLRSTLQCQ